MTGSEGAMKEPPNRAEVFSGAESAEAAILSGTDEASTLMVATGTRNSDVSICDA
jgi:hypothetical protein